MSDHLADALLQRDDRSIELLYFGQTRKDDLITHGGLSSLFIELSDLGHELGVALPPADAPFDALRPDQARRKSRIGKDDARTCAMHILVHAVHLKRMRVGDTARGRMFHNRQGLEFLDLLIRKLLIVPHMVFPVSVLASAYADLEFFRTVLRRHRPSDACIPFDNLPYHTLFGREIRRTGKPLPPISKPVPLNPLTYP